MTGSVDSNAPPGDQRKTFSKRKVVSNWEKYDEGLCIIKNNNIMIMSVNWLYTANMWTVKYSHLFT